MSNDVTTVVRSFLAPLLAFAALLLTLFAYLSPAAMFQTQVALMIITPGRSSPLPNNPHTIDGPTIRMGMLGEFRLCHQALFDIKHDSGSCAQPNNSAQVHCTTPLVPPTYGTIFVPDFQKG